MHQTSRSGALLNKRASTGTTVNPKLTSWPLGDLIILCCRCFETHLMLRGRADKHIGLHKYLASDGDTCRCRLLLFISFYSCWRGVQSDAPDGIVGALVWKLCLNCRCCVFECWGCHAYMNARCFWGVMILRLMLVMWWQVSMGQTRVRWRLDTDRYVERVLTIMLDKRSQSIFVEVWLWVITTALMIGTKFKAKNSRSRPGWSLSILIHHQ